MARLAPPAPRDPYPHARARKVARPWFAERPLEVTLRYRGGAAARLDRAGRRSPAHPAVIRYLRLLARRTARESGVRLYRVHATGRAVSFLLRAPERPALARFLRVYAGLAARRVTGARKGRPFGPFWEGPARSRVLTWGAEFAAAKEAMGISADRR